MPSREWRKHPLSSGWFSIEYRYVYPDRVGNWVKIANIASEQLADHVLEMGALGQI